MPDERFDKLCESAVRSAKVAHTELTIKLVYVSPYMSNSFNTQRDYYEYHYDDILIPMELAGVHYKGAITKKACGVGCIGCKKCEKTCPNGAISVKNNLAVLDPERCTGCGACVEACPVGCICQVC